MYMCTYNFNQEVGSLNLSIYHIYTYFKLPSYVRDEIVFFLIFNPLNENDPIKIQLNIWSHEKDKPINKNSKTLYLKFT